MSVAKFWTGERLWEVMGCVDQGMSDAEIAAQIGVTPEAVHIVRVRNGIRCVRARYLSAREVARRLGADEKSVGRWIERGWLRARRGDPPGGWQPQWYIEPDDLERFLHDDRYWPAWHPERITDPALRREMQTLRAGVRYLTPGEVARRMYCTVSTVNGWIHKGWLPARKYGNWWIDERDLARFELPKIGGYRGKERAA